MRAIYYVLFSYVCMYIATHIKGSERKRNEFRGFIAIMALGSLIASIGCAIVGV